MNKLTSIIIVLCFVLGGLGAAAIQPTDNDEYKILHKTLKLSITDLTITEKEEQYIRVSFSHNNQFLLNPGKPILPKFTQTFELPFGATNIEVQMTSSETTQQTINKQIQPSPAPIPLSPIVNYNAPLSKDEQIYHSNEPYPSECYRYNVGVGINEHFEHITYVTVHWYPIQYIPAQNIITITENADMTITYTTPKLTPFPQTTTYDMVIIAPSSFSDALQPLIDHKNKYGIETTLKTIEDIYTEYNGFDKAEQVKYFIKDALEQWNIKYVLLAGGLKSTIYAKPRDTTNIGASGWHIPVRYSNIDENGDAGYPTDLYYADIYKEGGAFENWDSDGDGILAEWPDDISDLIPDVAVGRLAFSDVKEVQEVVNKIITYETTSYGSDWFKKMIVIAGDGFIDQLDLNIQWDTKGLAAGAYTINAQSFNPEGDQGPVDTIHITLDDTVASQVTFNHDDHLNPILQNGYPAPPIAEIVSVSEGNILGNTDVTYQPSEGQAYCNDLFWWGNVSYVDGVLTIRGKSYDPKPYGNLTNIHVWVQNNQGDVVFSGWRNNTPMYYEGEWVTGEKAVNGRGGALYYMPEEFDTEILWTSNGKFTGPDDVISSYSEGYGFAYFSGHGSPGVWQDQKPGIPGNRQHATVQGLWVSNLRSYPPFSSKPVWPMKELSNNGKFPITVVGGCHNSLFSVSLIPSAMNYYT
ncbi:MAG: C25 family cysteine peptidase, partial [Euryarchaeota archaeon]|nr:C25 family cysteine peptidase [Euryarchaeota archaeon]